MGPNPSDLKTQDDVQPDHKEKEKEDFDSLLHVKKKSRVVSSPTTRAPDPMLETLSLMTIRAPLLPQWSLGNSDEPSLPKSPIIEHSGLSTPISNFSTVAIDRCNTICEKQADLIDYASQIQKSNDRLRYHLQNSTSKVEQDIMKLCTGTEHYLVFFKEKIADFTTQCLNIADECSLQLRNMGINVMSYEDYKEYISLNKTEPCVSPKGSEANHIKLQAVEL
ncbi:hypothetical protein PCE1_000883 [Barthelona sp. PCE]